MDSYATLAMRTYPSKEAIVARQQVVDSTHDDAWGGPLTVARAVLEEVLLTATADSPLWRQALEAERNFPERCYLPEDAEGRAWIAGFIKPLRQLANKT